MRRQECLAARGDPAVDGNLNQGFFDLIDRYTAGNRGIRVNAQLLKAAEPCEDSKREDAPCLLVKPGATPRITPSQFRNGSLKRHHEVIRTRKVRVHVLRPAADAGGLMSYGINLGDMFRIHAQKRPPEWRNAPSA